MEKAKKIYILVPPISGHVNPVACIAKKLVESGVEVVFYSSTKYQGIVKKTGATYREYQGDDQLYKPKKSFKETTNSLAVYVGEWLQFADQVLPQLIADVEKDKPDLIVYDLLALYAKFLRKILDNRFKTDPNNSTKPPELLEISSAFAMLPGVFPTNEQMKLFTRDNDKWFIITFFGLMAQQARFSIKYGVDVLNPLKFFFGKDFQTICLTTVFPEFQPKLEVFDQNIYKFVGSCIDEDCRKYQVEDPKLQQVLDEFQPVNPRKAPFETPESKKRLIYVSLGTVFLQNKFIYDKIISGIYKFQQQYDQYELKVVFSLGEAAFKEFEEEGFKIPANFVFQKSVPQIEILKRASLFVTHCGMNSCSETIFYAVPIIGIPIGAEQPINAIRMCDELHLGIQFESPLNIEANKMSESIYKILSDESYLSNICKLSEISRRYEGTTGACKEIIKFLDSKASVS